MRTLKKGDLHFIGHLRGIDQYDIKGDPKSLALVLKTGNRYFLSFAKSEEQYNTNIAVRIHNFHSPLGTIEDLGEEVEVIEGDN